MPAGPIVPAGPMVRVGTFPRERRQRAVFDGPLQPAETHGADALVEVCRQALTGGLGDRAGAAQPATRVLVHVDAEVLADQDRQGLHLDDQTPRLSR